MYTIKVKIKVNNINLLYLYEHMSGLSHYDAVGISDGK